jgi:DNA-binding IclR family transcriptional regulator
MPAELGSGSVTGRALKLLAAFTPEHPVLALTQLAQRTGLPLSTTHRLARELTEWGALEREPRGDYRIGLRLWEIASLMPLSFGLRDIVVPYLEELSQITRENAQIAVRDGLDVVFIERVAGHCAVSTFTKVGGRRPLHATGVGLALLAYAPADVQQRMFDSKLKAFTPYTVSTAFQLRQSLAEIRRTGVAVSDRQLSEETFSVAAPIFGPAAHVVAAISIVSRVGRIKPSDLVPAVRAAARGASLAVIANSEKLSFPESSATKGA